MKIKKKKKKPTYAAAARRLPAWLLRHKPRNPIARPSGSGSAILNIVNRRKRKQRGKGFGNVAKTIANSPYVQNVGKQLISKGINAIPSLFRRGTNKVKNKRLKKILQSEIAEELVNRGTTKLYGGIGL